MHNNCFVEYFSYPDDASSIAAGIPLPVILPQRMGNQAEALSFNCATLLPLMTPISPFTRGTFHSVSERILGGETKIVVVHAS